MASSIAPLCFAKHKDWKPVHMHTARCDHCPQDSLNTSVLQRCVDCGRQVCKNCMASFSPDGDHEGNVNDCDWTSAGESKKTRVKRGICKKPSTQPRRRSARVRTAPVVKKQIPETKKLVAKKPRRGEEIIAELHMVHTEKEKPVVKESQNVDGVISEPFTRKRQGEEPAEEEPAAKKQDLIIKINTGKRKEETTVFESENPVVAEPTNAIDPLSKSIVIDGSHGTTVPATQSSIADLISPQSLTKEVAEEEEIEVEGYERDEEDEEDDEFEKDEEDEEGTSTRPSWSPFVPNPAKQVPDKFKGKFVPNYPTVAPISAERWTVTEAEEKAAQREEELAAFREQVEPEFYTSPVIQRYVKEGRMQEALELFEFARMGMEAKMGL